MKFLKIFLLVNLAPVCFAYEKNMTHDYKIEALNQQLSINKKLTTMTYLVNGIFTLGTLYCVYQLGFNNLSVDADLKYSRFGFLSSIVSLASALYIKQLNAENTNLDKQIRNLELM